MSEKRKPHHDLKAIRASFATVKSLKVTGNALRDAFALGFTSDDIVATIQSISPKHFYKSMTAYHDHRQGQDV